MIAKGRNEQAIHALAKYHANGNRDDPLVEFEYNEIKEAIEMERHRKQSVSFLKLFNSKGNLKRMRIIIGMYKMDNFYR